MVMVDCKNIKECVDRFTQFNQIFLPSNKKYSQQVMFHIASIRLSNIKTITKTIYMRSCNETLKLPRLVKHFL